MAIWYAEERDRSDQGGTHHPPRTRQERAASPSLASSSQSLFAPDLPGRKLGRSSAVVARYFMCSQGRRPATRPKSIQARSDRASAGRCVDSGGSTCGSPFHSQTGEPQDDNAPASRSPYICPEPNSTTGQSSSTPATMSVTFAGRRAIALSHRQHAHPRMGMRSGEQSSSRVRRLGRPARTVASAARLDRVHDAGVLPAVARDH